MKTLSSPWTDRRRSRTRTTSPAHPVTPSADGRVRQSYAACTRTSASPGPASGRAVSATFSTSGGPNLSWTTAFNGSRLLPSRRAAVRSGYGFGFRQAGGRTDRGALRAATCAADGLTVVWRSAGVDSAGTTRSARQRRNRARDSGVYKLCERGCWPSSVPRSCWPGAEARWRRGRLAPLRRERGPRRGRVPRVRQLSRRACGRAARPPRGGDAVPRRPGSRPAF